MDAPPSAPAPPPARAPPPPRDVLSNIPRIPDLHCLVAFQPAKPQPLPNLPDPIQNVETQDRYSFSSFLDAIQEHNIEMWEKDLNGRVLNVSAVGRKVFLSMGKIVAGMHRNGQFAGNLIDRIRIYGDQSVNFPFPNMNPNAETNLTQGKLTDLIHFRRMVAMVIVTSFPSPPNDSSISDYYNNKLSDTFKLFFSGIYIYFPDEYSIFQLLHPIFFDASDRMSFLQLILDFSKENSIVQNGLRHLDHQFPNWWEKFKKPDFPKEYKAIFERVYTFREYKQQSSKLPSFIRNMHHHYWEKGQKEFPKHEDIDSLLHKTFPGVCEVIVDGQIRSNHYDWQFTGPWKPFYRSLAKYFITKPYPFTVERYRYQY